MLDAEALAEMLAPVIAGEVERAIAPLSAKFAVLEERKPEPGPPGPPGPPGEKGEDAKPQKEWAEDLTTDEKAALVSAMLRKELGDDELIVLPDPLPFQGKSASQPSAPIEIHNHLPKRGIEKTVVTKHDERGRVIEFERREV